MQLRISEQELKQRQQRVVQFLDEKGYNAFVFFNSTSVFYLTGFTFMPTERPLALVLQGNGQTLLYVPGLETEHAEETALVDEIEHYQDYPGTTHPMREFAELLRAKNLGKRTIAADSGGYGSAQGYRGPRLEEVLPDAEIAVEPTYIEELRMIKSEAELALMRESAKWGNLAHRLLQDYSKPGANETEVSVRASLEASMLMVKTLGEQYEPRGGSMGAHTGFRGQIGANAALPHAINKNLVLKPGDVLVTGAGASVWGYGSELERTMFVGEPDNEQERFFDLMMGAQQVAFDAIRPGETCASVDAAVREYYEAEGITQYWRHHTGHALGLLGHEAPFFDVGDETVMKPGMVFSIEPGLYVPGLGGFRHSDTVFVTEEGMEFLTYYPRDLESMICPL